MLQLKRCCLAALLAVACACGSSSDGGGAAECLALAPCASARLMNARTLVDGFLVVLKNADDPTRTPLPPDPVVPPTGLNAFFDHGTRAFGFDADLDGVGLAETPLRGTATGEGCNGMNPGHVCVFDWEAHSSLIDGTGRFSLNMLTEVPARHHRLTIVAFNPVLDLPEACRLEITRLDLYMDLYGDVLFYSPAQIDFRVTRGDDAMTGFAIGTAVSGTCNGTPFACTLNPDDFAMSSCADVGG